MADRPQAFINAIVNGNMAGNLISIPTICDKLSMMSYSYSWAGASPVGTVSVQVSDDYSEFPNGQVNNAGTWNTLPLSSGNTVALTGNTGNGGIDVLQTGFYAIRTIYTFTSGSGALQVDFNGKVA